MIKLKQNMMCVTMLAIILKFQKQCKVTNAIKCFGVVTKYSYLTKYSPIWHLPRIHYEYFVVFFGKSPTH